MALSQDYRLIRINTPLGVNKVFVESFTACENLFEPFEFKVEAFCEQSYPSFEKLLGHPVVFSIPLKSGEERHFHGFVANLKHKDSREAAFRFEMTVRPWFWLLSLTQDCRIFQDKSVIEIAEMIFGEFGFTDFEIRVQKNYQPIEYCVQYNESYLDFLTRLFEKYGLYYYFDHKFDSHRMIIIDTTAQHDPCEFSDVVRYKRDDVVDEDMAISSWDSNGALHTGSYAMGDFNFEKPKVDLNIKVDALESRPATRDLSTYLYHGQHGLREIGEKFAETQMQSIEAEEIVTSGVSNCTDFRPGFTFELQDHYQEENNREFLLVEVKHIASNNFEHIDEKGAAYRNEVRCYNTDLDFRVPEKTPKPRISGIQTAFVVGPAGEEIYVDKYGRVKVQFHWDRRSKSNEKSSCWLRVAQSWSGNRWGGTITPRIGMEVLVSFLDGDPDRPIIVGCVPNADSLPPYSLPADKTKTVFKTNSSPGGGGHNEIMFDDKKGKEQVYLHAEKNMDVRVKNLRRDWVGGHKHQVIEGARYDLVKDDAHFEVSGDQNGKIGGIASLEVSENIHTKAGTGISLKAGTDVRIDAGVSITLKAGGSLITLNPGGVFIKGPMVMINSGGSPSGQVASPQAPYGPQYAIKSKSGGEQEVPKRKLPELSGDRSRIAQVAAMREAASARTPLCQMCEEGAK